MICDVSKVLRLQKSRVSSAKLNGKSTGNFNRKVQISVCYTMFACKTFTATSFVLGIKIKVFVYRILTKYRLSDENRARYC